MSSVIVIDLRHALHGSLWFGNFDGACCEGLIQDS